MTSLESPVVPLYPPVPVARSGVAAHLPGLALVATIALVAIGLGRLAWFDAHGISALTIAIVIGIAVGNTFYPRIAHVAEGGVAFSKKQLLQLSIVLYGLRLTFHDIGDVGMAGVLIDAVVLSSTFGLAWFVGTRVFGLERNVAMLIGAGSSICGAAAVMATGPVIRGRPEEVAIAVSTVVVFGTLAIFAYPALFHLVESHRWFALSTHAYGIYAGSTIHEVAQVVAAGRAVGNDAADTAVIAKLVRVMMLAPFLVALSAWMARTARDAAPTSRKAAIALPWFALGFIGVAALNSTGWIDPSLVARLVDVDTFVLAMAMAALGLTTHVSAIRTAGAKPLLLAALLFGWLVIGGIVINLGVSRWFAA